MGYGFYDITLYAHLESINNKDFPFRRNLISDLYIDFLDGYKPKGTTRISADIGSEDHIKGYFGSILSVEVAFDEKEYWLSSDETRNKIILHTIHRIAIFCAEKYGWDKMAFEQANRRVLESDFIYNKEFKKKKSSDKQHQAALVVEKNGKSALISVNFYNSKGNFLKSVELLRSFHHQMFYGKIVSNNKWFNDLEFGMYAKKGEVVIKASLDTENSEIILTPTINTLEELEGYLRNITYKEFTDKSEYIQWANK